MPYESTQTEQAFIPPKRIGYSDSQVAINRRMGKVVGSVMTGMLALTAGGAAMEAMGDSGDTAVAEATVEVTTTLGDSIIIPITETTEAEVPTTAKRDTTTTQITIPTTITTTVAEPVGLNNRSPRQTTTTTTVAPTTTLLPETTVPPTDPPTLPPETVPEETLPPETLPPETVPPETEAPYEEPPAETDSNVCSDKYDDYKTVKVGITPWATLQKLGLTDPEIGFLVDNTDFLKRSGLKGAQSGDSITLPTASNIRCSYAEL